MFRPDVKFGPIHVPAGVQFQILQEGFGLKPTLFLESSEWEVVNTTNKICAKVYNQSENDFSYPTFQVTLSIKRRPKFYVITLILPLLSVVLIPTIGFLLPIESGEKVSLQVTAFLSYMVLLLVVIEVIPATADHFPVIGMLLTEFSFQIKIEFEFL